MINGIIWPGSIIGLNYVWYADFDKSKFHFFNDSKEWGQMDKMGHFYTSYQMSRVVGDMYQWSGVNHKKSAIIGSSYSFCYLLTFEVLDAYNSKWGFSWSDIGFNSIGSISYFSQAYFFNKQYVKPKFSFHKTGLAEIRPNALGNDFASRTLKDYNGQTYWLSFNPFTWSTNRIKIPKWINLSIGYSINNQLIGDGSTYVMVTENNTTIFDPYRQLFLSLDVDFEAIPTKSRALKMIFRTLNIIKIPFPAIEYSQHKLSFRPLYF